MTERSKEPVARLFVDRGTVTPVLSYLVNTQFVVLVLSGCSTAGQCDGFWPLWCTPVRGRNGGPQTLLTV